MKFSVMEIPENRELINGYFQRIGLDASFYDVKLNGEKLHRDVELPNHLVALECIKKELVDLGIVKTLDEIDAVGHRLVHGGEEFKNSVIITDEVIETIRECIPLAPLHNPAGLTGIEACKKVMPGKPMVAVFDTAFHQTIPEERYIYPIPYKYYEKYGVRKYGFHGTSHRYVSQRVAELVGKKKEELKTIVCHLGQGASLCAVEYGKSVDTSMGFTPLAGIAMGTRSGDLDPSIVTFLMKKEGLSADEVEKILNKESGLLGISELSADNRDLLESIDKNDENAKKCKIAMETYCYIIAQYIAKYAVAMNGVDVIAFAGGVGERGPDERAMICNHLTWMGVELDKEANKVKAEEQEISSSNSKVKVWVVPTEEELMIARDTRDLVK